MVVSWGVLLAHAVAVVLGRGALVVHGVLAFDQGILVVTFVLLVLVQAALGAVGLATGAYESSIDFVGRPPDALLGHLVASVAVRWCHAGGLALILLIPGTGDLTAVAIAHLTALRVLV